MMSDKFIKDVIESSKEDGYNKARFEWHDKLIEMMKWVHGQAELHKDNIEVYLAYEKCFDHINEVLDGDYK